MKNYTIAALHLGAFIALSPIALGEEPIPLREVSHIHGIAFDPSEPGSFFLATHQGLYKGRPDRTATRISAESSDFMGFTPDPADPGRLLASGHPSNGGNLGVIASEDGGVTWTPIANGVEGPVDFHAMAASRADPQTLYGVYGDLQISRDGGKTWSVAPSTPPQIIDLAAPAGEPQRVLAATMTGLMESADGGQSWQTVGPTNIPVSLVEATSDGSLFAYFASAGLFKKSPVDGTWSALVENLGEVVFLHLAIDPADPTHLLAVTQAAEIWESGDGGATWSKLSP